MLIQFSCMNTGSEYNSTVEVLENYAALEEILDQYQDKILVINFWATTCPPCLKEMPHFNELERNNTDEKIKLLLISLDREKDLNSRVYPFVKRMSILGEVKLLADQNYSAWTEKIDTSWYGALPATLIRNGDSTKFRFGAYESYDDLEMDVNSMGTL